MPVNLGVTVVCFDKRNNCSRKLLQSETMIGAVCRVLGVVFSLATGAVMAAAGCGIEEQECILGKTSIEVAVSSCLKFIRLSTLQPTQAGSTIQMVLFTTMEPITYIISTIPSVSIGTI